jgi:hypothetical protein
MLETAGAERGRALTAAWADRRTIVAAWAGSRVLVLAGAIGLHWVRRPRGYFGAPIFHHLLGPLEAWDGTWYRLIAAHGYLLVPGRQSDPAFFPLYPLLLKGAGSTGIPLGLAGVLLSNALFLGALLAFDMFGREVVGTTRAREATVILAVFPTTYVCSMVYPESLLLLTFALAGWFASTRRWTACAIAAALAGLARPEGALLVLPIAAAVAARWRDAGAQERGRAAAAVLAAPAAAASFPLYLGWALHDPFAWSKAQHAWGRSFRSDGVMHAFTGLVHQLGHQAWSVRDLVFCFVTLALLAAAWRLQLPRAWTVLGLLLVVLPLGSGSFESDARFGLVALPAYWALAAPTRGRAARRTLLTVSVALLVAATWTLPLVFP